LPPRTLNTYWLVNLLIVWQAGCSKVPACAFAPGKEASDDGYLRGAPIGAGEGGTNVGKGLLIAYVSIAEVVR